MSAALSDQLTTINRETIMFRKFLIVLLSLAFLGGFGIAEADGNKGKLVLINT